MHETGEYIRLIWIFLLNRLRVASLVEKFTLLLSSKFDNQCISNRKPEAPRTNECYWLDDYDFGTIYTSLILIPLVLFFSCDLLFYEPPLGNSVMN